MFLDRHFHRQLLLATPWSSLKREQVSLTCVKDQIQIYSIPVVNAKSYFEVLIWHSDYKERLNCIVTADAVFLEAPYKFTASEWEQAWTHLASCYTRVLHMLNSIPSTPASFQTSAFTSPLERNNSPVRQRVTPTNKLRSHEKNKATRSPEVKRLIKILKNNHWQELGYSSLDDDPYQIIVVETYEKTNFIDPIRYFQTLIQCTKRYRECTTAYEIDDCVVLAVTDAEERGRVDSVSDYWNDFWSEIESVYLHLLATNFADFNATNFQLANYTISANAHQAQNPMHSSQPTAQLRNTIPQPYILSTSLPETSSSLPINETNAPIPQTFDSFVPVDINLPVAESGMPEAMLSSVTNLELFDLDTPLLQEWLQLSDMEQTPEEPIPSISKLSMFETNTPSAPDAENDIDEPLPSTHHELPILHEQNTPIGSFEPNLLIENSETVCAADTVPIVGHKPHSSTQTDSDQLSIQTENAPQQEEIDSFLVDRPYPRPLDTAQFNPTLVSIADPIEVEPSQNSECESQNMESVNNGTSLLIMEAISSLDAPAESTDYPQSPYLNFSSIETTEHLQPEFLPAQEETQVDTPQSTLSEVDFASLISATQPVNFALLIDEFEAPKLDLAAQIFTMPSCHDKYPNLNLSEAIITEHPPISMDADNATQSTSINSSQAIVENLPGAELALLSTAVADNPLNEAEKAASTAANQAANVPENVLATNEVMQHEPISSMDFQTELGQIPDELIVVETIHSSRDLSIQTVPESISNNKNPNLNTSRIMALPVDCSKTQVDSSEEIQSTSLVQGLDSPILMTEIPISLSIEAASPAFDDNLSVDYADEEMEHNIQQVNGGPVSSTETSVADLSFSAEITQERSPPPCRIIDLGNGESMFYNSEHIPTGIIIEESTLDTCTLTMQDSEESTSNSTDNESTSENLTQTVKAFQAVQNLLQEKAKKHKLYNRIGYLFTGCTIEQENQNYLYQLDSQQISGIRGGNDINNILIYINDLLKLLKLPASLQNSVKFVINEENECLQIDEIGHKILQQLLKGIDKRKQAERCTIFEYTNSISFLFEQSISWNQIKAFKTKRNALIEDLRLPATHKFYANRKNHELYINKAHYYAFHRAWTQRKEDKYLLPILSLKQCQFKTLAEGNEDKLYFVPHQDRSLAALCIRLMSNAKRFKMDTQALFGVDYTKSAVWIDKSRHKEWCKHNDAKQPKKPIKAYSRVFNQMKDRPSLYAHTPEADLDPYEVANELNRAVKRTNLNTHIVQFFVKKEQVCIESAGYQDWLRYISWRRDKRLISKLDQRIFTFDADHGVYRYFPEKDALTFINLKSWARLFNNNANKLNLLGKVVFKFDHLSVYTTPNEYKLWLSEYKKYHKTKIQVQKALLERAFKLCDDGIFRHQLNKDDQDINEVLQDYGSLAKKLKVDSINFYSEKNRYICLTIEDHTVFNEAMLKYSLKTPKQGYSNNLKFILNVKDNHYHCIPEYHISPKDLCNSLNEQVLSYSEKIEFKYSDKTVFIDKKGYAQWLKYLVSISTIPQRTSTIDFMNCQFTKSNDGYFYLQCDYNTVNRYYKAFRAKALGLKLDCKLVNFQKDEDCLKINKKGYALWSNALESWDKFKQEKMHNAGLDTHVFTEKNGVMCLNYEGDVVSRLNDFNRSITILKLKNIRFKLNRDTYEIEIPSDDYKTWLAAYKSHRVEPRQRAIPLIDRQFILDEEENYYYHQPEQRMDLKNLTYRFNELATTLFPKEKDRIIFEKDDAKYRITLTLAEYEKYAAEVKQFKINGLSKKPTTVKRQIIAREFEPINLKRLNDGYKHTPEPGIKISKLRQSFTRYTKCLIRDGHLHANAGVQFSVQNNSYIFIKAEHYRLWTAAIEKLNQSKQAGKTNKKTGLQYLAFTQKKGFFYYKSTAEKVFNLLRRFRQKVIELGLDPKEVKFERWKNSIRISKAGYKIWVDNKDRLNTTTSIPPAQRGFALITENSPYKGWYKHVPDNPMDISQLCKRFRRTAAKIEELRGISFEIDKTGLPAIVISADDYAKWSSTMGCPTLTPSQTPLNVTAVTALNEERSSRKRTRAQPRSTAKSKRITVSSKPAAEDISTSGSTTSGTDEAEHTIKLCKKDFVLNRKRRANILDAMVNQGLFKQTHRDKQKNVPEQPSPTHNA